MTIELQRCGHCGAFQYPARDLCRMCLSDALRMAAVQAGGIIVSEARICRSLEPERLTNGPLRIGAVALDVGVRVIALLDGEATAGTRVLLHRTDSPERPLVASRSQPVPEQG